MRTVERVSVSAFRITNSHQSDVPARELAERASHSRPSMSLDVYSHVMRRTIVRFLSLLPASR